MTTLQHGTVLVRPSLSMTFQPEAWNDPDLVKHVNCFAYALNEPRTAFPFVGNAIKPSRISPEKREEHDRLISSFRKISNGHISYDLQLRFHGMERIRKHQFDPAKRHIFAFSPYLGHFFRLDGNKKWSHKNGSNPAKNTDHKGNIIDDLETAAIGLPPIPDKDAWKKRDLAYYFQKLDEIEREKKRSLSEETVLGRMALRVSDYIESYKEQPPEIKMPFLRFDASEILYYAVPEDGIAISTNLGKFDYLCETADRLGL